MIIEIDHIIVAAHDADAAAADLADALGLAPAGGGVHAAIGTRNALLSLAGPYLEVIGLADDDPATRQRARRHPIGAAVVAALDGLAGPLEAGSSATATIAGGASAAGGPALLAYVSMALRTDDAALDARDLTAAGFSPGTLAEVMRRRGDGSVVRWPIVLPERLGPSLPPFLIEHGPAEPERAARLAGGGIRIDVVEIPAADPESVAAAWGRALDLASTPRRRTAAGGAADASDAGAGSEVVIGPHRVFLRPARAVSEPVVLRLAGGPGSPRIAARGGVEIRVG